MKLKIKVNTLDPMCRPEVIKKGDWIDLKSRGNYFLEGPKVIGGKVAFDSKVVPLGVAMRLPAGFEAEVRPRSSTFKTWHIMETNGVGTIDNSYCGNQDEWKMPVIAFESTAIGRGERICQFRIMPSQRATFWQKLKWLLSSGIKLEYVFDLRCNNRGGFGSTGTI